MLTETENAHGVHNTANLMGRMTACLFTISSHGVCDQDMFSKFCELWGRLDIRMISAMTCQNISATFVVVEKYISIGVPVELVVDKILSDWFYNWLPLCDILYLTAVVLTSPTIEAQRHIAKVLAALIAKYASEIQPRHIEEGLFGTEIVLSCMAAASASKRSCDGTFSVLGTLRTGVYE